MPNTQPPHATTITSADADALEAYLEHMLGLCEQAERGVTRLQHEQIEGAERETNIHSVEDSIHNL